jgi:cyclophilin family peptidyl-prolyl cis-trans isomerase
MIVLLTSNAPSALLLLVALAAGPTLAAQTDRLTSADSALVGRILLAEDRRDVSDEALAVGARHANQRVRLLARRAAFRIGDPLFSARDSLPKLEPPPAWPEPAWRLRYRELADRRNDCAAIRQALSDSAWPVRLRAADLVTPACSGDELLADTLRKWADSLPEDLTSREAGNVSWHAAAHALVALSRLQPADARSRLAELARHPVSHLRRYAAAAAALLTDTATLQGLIRDRDPNVREAAIEGLSTLTGHGHDELYMAALAAPEAQVVRVAALALAGSPRVEARTAASAAFERWAARENASERDVRVALLAAAGRDTSEDRRPAAHYRLPPDALALALGADIRLRVLMAPASGGGSFVVRLRGDVAPMTAARILELVRARYYDGLTWHRVEHDFVIQGGSPGANEYVGLDQYFRDELGTVPHLRGTVGMSTRGHDTGDAQWFVNLRDNLRLGRDYTVFAEVVEGIAVVDGILEGDVIATIRPVSDAEGGVPR